MIDEPQASDAAAVKLALDAAALRHHAIANNIANARTPGYQPRAARTSRSNLRGAAFLDVAADAARRTCLGERRDQAREPAPVAERAGGREIDVGDGEARAEHGPLPGAARGLGKQMAIMRTAIERREAELMDYARLSRSALRDAG